MDSEIFKKICDVLGHSFKDKVLLETALTHSSMLEEENYERLEFLGDRVLGLLVTDVLFHRFPAEAEGSLARRHTALVCEDTLVEVARKIGLGDFIIMSDAEGKSGGAEKPAILADVMEALLGALYLDGGLPAAQSFVLREWEPLLETYTAPPIDPKTALQEWAQGRGLPLPEYAIIDKSGSDHEPVFTVAVRVKTLGRVEAVAPSKRAAEKKAAELMLSKIKETQGNGHG